MKNVLIYGAVNDVHLVRVATLLIEQRLSVYFIDPIEMPMNSCQFGWGKGNFCKNEALNFETRENEAIDLDNVVFWRRNKRRITTFYNEQEQHLHYTFAEIDNFLDGLVNSAQVTELSSTQARVKHEHKLFQLKMAEQVSLSIPPTLISNHKTEILDFVQQYEKCIAKPLKHPVWSPPVNQPNKGATFLVNIVTEQEIQVAEAESFAHYPLIFQQYICKDHELRIICVADKCVAFKIDSQTNDKAQIDWRRGTKELMYNQIDIPDTLQQLLCRYIEVTGIGYGVFDFVYDTNGQYIFLECNSDGQWAFLEKTDEICPVAPLFAEQLIKLSQQ